MLLKNSGDIRPAMKEKFSYPAVPVINSSIIAGEDLARSGWLETGDRVTLSPPHQLMMVITFIFLFILISDARTEFTLNRNQKLLK